MQDHYTCICGSVEWIISNDYVECASCPFKYRMLATIPPDDFNKRIRKGFAENNAKEEE